MKNPMMIWMYDNATRIANANKENAVVVAFLYELFDYHEGGINSLLDYASQGYGYNMMVFSNFILNDLEFGQKSDGV